MTATVSLSQHDWSLHRKGPVDQARHAEKVKEAIKQNLGEIVAEEAIITSEGQKLVKIPIRSLDLPHFRYDHRKRQHVGQGHGKAQVGDVLGQDPGPATAPGRGRRAGETPGIDYYEVEVTVDELAALLFEDLGLPRLQQKAAEHLEVETIRFKDVHKRGIMANLDKRRTLLENLKRHAVAHGRPVLGPLSLDDLRFRTWAPEFRRESNAVVIAMRDVSGSMGEFEKYITRSFYFWMVRFLRTKYHHVQIVFLTHHTEAQEVDEAAFFRLGESGGTKVSSAYALALALVQARYDPQRWNIYPFHFSDGDNWGDADNRRCLDLVRQLLQVSNVFGYGEIHEYNYGSSSTLLATFQALKDDPAFIPVIIRDRKDVYPALRKFFHVREELPA